MDVDGGNTNSHTLTGLTNGQTYTIYIVSTSSSPGVLPSAPVSAGTVGLGMRKNVVDHVCNVFGLVPPAPVLGETPTVTATTINITGTVPSGSVVAGFVVEWQRDTSVGCSDEDEDRVSVNGAFISYSTITGLEPGNRYTITVTVSNSAGSSGVSNTVTAMTEETGERD